MQKSRKAIMIHSPHSGRSAQLAEAVNALHQTGVEVVDSLPITALINLPPQGDRWREYGIDIVIAAGGDGLVGGVTSHATAGKLPLGILPLGTANDVARTVDIPQDITQAAHVIASGKHVEVDIGVAYPAEKQPPSTSPRFSTEKCLFFTHALTVGLNVQFARLATNKAMRQQFGSMTYPVAVVEALKVYQPIDVRLHFEGLAMRPAPYATNLVASNQERTLHCRAAQATVVNAPIFWGPLQATVPGVSLRDRLLDVVVIEDASLEQLMIRVLRFFSQPEMQRAAPTEWHKQYANLLPAQLTGIAGIHHVKARSVTITTEENPQDVTLDGEVLAQTPIQARVADEKLCLIVPPTTNLLL